MAGISISGCRKRGLSLRGAAIMTVLAVLMVSAVLESTLPSFRLSYKIQSGAGNGCANLISAWDFLVVSAGENLHAHKIPRFRGGGGYSGFWGGGGILGFGGGGGKCRFYSYGSGDFFDKKTARLHKLFFFKVRANFCLFPCDTSQDPNGNCSEKLVEMNFFIWVDFPPQRVCGICGFFLRPHKRRQRIDNFCLHLWEL